jgi:hypothetical protein
LAHTPKLYLLALTQFSITADMEVVRFSNTLFYWVIDGAVDEIFLACSSAFQTSAYGQQ